MRTNKTLGIVPIIALIIGAAVGYFVSASPSQPCTPCPEPCEVVCRPASFCGIDKDKFVGYAKSYRDSVWSKTSPYYTYNDYGALRGNDSATDSRFASTNQNCKWFDTRNHADTALFDSRYIDVSIADMKNYICNIEKSLDSNINVIRFYYIRYDIAPKSLLGYTGKHSLAAIPTFTKLVGSQHETVFEYLEEDPNGTGGTFIWDLNLPCSKTAVMNHNHLCPPVIGCDAKNTSLGLLIDQRP